MEAELWGQEYDENLTYQDPDDLVEAILDEPGKPFPEKLKIVGFARMEAANVGILHPLEQVLETLDEEYGDPDQATEPTDTMKAAERAFLEVIKKEYVPWTCEPICTMEIVVADWLKEHHPDWL